MSGLGKKCEFLWNFQLKKQNKQVRLVSTFKIRSQIDKNSRVKIVEAYWDVRKLQAKPTGMFLGCPTLPDTPLPTRLADAASAGRVWRFVLGFVKKVPANCERHRSAASLQWSFTTTASRCCHLRLIKTSLALSLESVRLSWRELMALGMGLKQS